MHSLLNRVTRPRGRGAVKREHAEYYVLLMLLSFATSVTATRLFLEVTGYPQLGNSELHIAHVVWGGLLLFVAALLPLVVANRWALTAGALLGGAGAGLFIDEIGKFITQSNDYFYPFAAPIIYAFFLITVLIYLRVRRPVSEDPRGELYRALDGLMEVLDHDLEPAEHAVLEARLERVAAQSAQTDYAHLAEALLVFLRFGAIDLAPERPPFWQRLVDAWRAFEDWLGQERYRRLLIAGMAALGMVVGGQLVISLLALFFPQALKDLAIEVLNTETLVRSATSLTWYLVRMVLEGAIGGLLAAGGLLLALGRQRLGVRLGQYGLLVALTTVNLLIFYFDQFGTIALSLIQFGLLVSLGRYRHLYLSVLMDEQPPPAPDPAQDLDLERTPNLNRDTDLEPNSDIAHAADSDQDAD